MADEGQGKEAMGLQSMIYAFVSRGTVVLARYTEYTRNLTTTSSQSQPIPDMVTFSRYGLTFNYLVEDGFTYGVIAVDSVGQQMPVAFLVQIKDQFSKTYGGGKAATAAASSSSREFGSKLKEYMQYRADHPEEIVKNVMMENDLKELELLADMTKDFAKKAQLFWKQGTKPRRKTWLQNMFHYSSAREGGKVVEHV